MIKSFFKTLLFFSLFVSCKNSTIFELMNPNPEKTEVTTQPALPLDHCNWGITGPRYFECDQTIYIYGITIYCKSGNYQNLFCREDYINNGQACLSDKSPETMLCYHEVIGKHLIGLKP